MHPFKSFWDRRCFGGEGESAGDGEGKGNDTADIGDPGADPMGGTTGVGAGGTNATGSGSNAEGAGSDPGTGAGVGAKGESTPGETEAPSAQAPENAVSQATAVGTMGTTNTSATTSTSATASQEEDATPTSTAPSTPSSKQGFSSVSDAMTEEEAMTNVTPTDTPSMSTSVAANVSSTKSTGPNPSNKDQSESFEAAIADVAAQLGVSPSEALGMLGNTNAAQVGVATATTDPTTGAVSHSVSISDRDTAQAGGPPGTTGPSGPQGGATQSGAQGTPDTEQGTPSPAGTPTGTTEGTPTAPGTPTGTTEGSGNTGASSGQSQTGAPGSGEGQASPTAQSFSNIGSPTGAPKGAEGGTPGVADMLGAILGAVNPIGSAQAQMVDPNTGGFGGGQAQQSMTEEEEQDKANKGKSFGGVAQPGTVDVREAFANMVRGLMGQPQSAPPSTPGVAPAVPSFTPDGKLGPMSMITGQPLPSSGVVSPTPPPLPTPGQVNAPPITAELLEEAGITGVKGGTPGKQGFAGMAPPAQPPAPAMPPRGPATGPIGPPTAPSVPKGFPGGFGVSPERSEETKNQVEAMVAPQTIEQIMNQPPAPVYSRMPAPKVPGVSLLDRFGKGQPGVMSQSGDGTGGSGTPGAQGQAPGAKGQSMKGEDEEAAPKSAVPALPTNFGNVASAPPEAAPPQAVVPALPPPQSVVPALPQLPSITTTQQPTAQVTPAATIDENAPQSFEAAMNAANKQMSVQDAMTTIGRLREQATAVLGNPNSTPQAQAAAKSYLDKTQNIATAPTLDTSVTTPNIQANQQKAGVPAAIAGNKSIGLIDQSFVNATVNPVTMETTTNVAKSAGRLGASAVPGVAGAVLGIASRAAPAAFGNVRGADLDVTGEVSPAGTPGARGGSTADDDQKGDNSGFGRVAGLSSPERLAEIGLGEVTSFGDIGSGSMYNAVDYRLMAGDASGGFAGMYSLPGSVDDPDIPEAGRRMTNSFLLRRVA